MTESTNTELALPVINPEQYPALYVAGGLDPYYQQIREQVMSEVPDVNSKKGIDRIKSLASMVSRSKTAVEKPGRDYLKHLKEQPKIIEAELRDWVSKMDALRDEVRYPVTELEQKEKARIAALDQRLNEIHKLGSCAEFDVLPSETINAWIEKLDAIAIDATWDEYQDRASAAKEAAKVKLSSALQTRLTWEAQQAEIAMLKAKQEEKDRLQREEQIRINARHEAEQQALRDKLAAEQREQEAKDAKERAEKQLEQERLEAAERQRVAVERAAEQERQRHLEKQKRIQYEAEQARIEADIKAADVEHQRAFNREAIADLLAHTPELTEQQAIKILTAIIRSEIRHISIQY